MVRWFARLLTVAVGGGLAVVPITAIMVLIASQVPAASKAASFGVPTVGALEPLDVRSVVLDRNGNRIATLRSEQNRSPVTIDKVPKALINAVLDVEDADFYRHKGFNLRSTIRALFANVEAGGVAQGGSTITQQLVKISLLSSAQKLDRKVREARLAIQIERKYTKDQILERYLNAVYFGQGAYGVQAAAEQYFAKPVERLNVAEAAFLAGMIRNPLGYDPTRNLPRSRARRATVLSRMVVEGHLTAAQAKALALAPMPRPADRLTKPETYFIEEVKQRLLGDTRLGDTTRDRYNAVFNGGLTIKTTFDPTAQAQAEAAVRDTIPAGVTEFTASLVSVDVDTGAVRAMVGGRGFETDKFNLATQGKRQPGSSWKPFTLIAALESGISPKSSVSGLEPCPIPNPGGLPDPYLPGNAEQASGKVASVLDQLVVSSNCAYARLAYIVGYDKVAKVAKDLGIRTPIDLVPAMALGAEEVHPIDMAGAYATIAAEGKKRTPYLVEEVLDRDGKVVIKADHGGKQVIPTEIARAVISAMQRVVTSGTGTNARLPDREVAGKTGTTNNYEDAWFVGYTPQVATAVWMGAPEAKISMRDVGGIRVFGGSYPARIWKAYMEKALAGTPSVDFVAPDEKAFAKGECLAVTVEKSLLREVRRGSSSGASAVAALTPSGVGGRGFSVAGGPMTVAVNGPSIPKATSRIAGKGRTCADYLGGATKPKTKATKRRVSTDSTPDTFVPVQVANPVDVGDLPRRAEHATPPPVTAVSPAAETPATQAPATTPPSASPPAEAPPG